VVARRLSARSDVVRTRTRAPDSCSIVEGRDDVGRFHLARRPVALTESNFERVVGEHDTVFVYMWAEACQPCKGIQARVGRARRRLARRRRRQDPRHRQHAARTLETESRSLKGRLSSGSSPANSMAHYQPSSSTRTATSSHGPRVRPRVRTRGPQTGVRPRLGYREPLRRGPRRSILNDDSPRRSRRARVRVSCVRSISPRTDTETRRERGERRRDQPEDVRMFEAEMGAVRPYPNPGVAAIKPSRRWRESTVLA